MTVSFRYDEVMVAKTMTATAGTDIELSKIITKAATVSPNQVVSKKPDVVTYDAATGKLKALKKGKAVVNILYGEGSNAGVK